MYNGLSMELMNQSLKNKIAVITGGGRGIGRAIAEAYAREGADLFLIARTAHELSAAQKDVRKYGGRVEVEPADVSRTEDAEKIRRRIASDFGRADVVVNAAGIYGPIGALEDTDPDEWMKTFSINVFGTMLMCRALLPMMKKQNSGRIINFSGGGEGPFPRFSAYASSKGAIVRFTESLDREARGNNIFVNAITPGAVNTAFLDTALAAGSEKTGEGFYQKLLRQKEEGGVSPEKAAALCVFLASDAARGIGGKVISAQWDRWSDFSKHVKEITESDVYTFRRVKPKDRGYEW